MTWESLEEFCLFDLEAWDGRFKESNWEGFWETCWELRFKQTNYVDNYKICKKYYFKNIFETRSEYYSYKTNLNKNPHKTNEKCV